MLVTEGRIARVNLTTLSVTYEPSLKYSDLIGGRALGSYLVFHEVPENSHPLDPENILVFSTSPLTGTLAPCSGRLSISCKNVATGGISFSNAGGHFAPEMKYAGIDHLVILGKSPYPVYLFIHEGVVEIKSAANLWGLDAWETEDLIKQDLNNGALHVASIGQAGENLVTMACIMVDRARAAGWGGCGAVMGSKNLKAVAAHGNRMMEVENPDFFIEICKKMWKKMDGSRTIHLFRKYGLLGTSGAGGIDGSVPQSVRNMEDEVWDSKKTLKMKEIIFKENYETLRLANFSCPVNCSHFYHVKEGPFSGLKLEALKTNVYRAFGTNLDVDNRELILKMNETSNRFGINCDSLSAVIAWIIDVFERGLVNRNETEGRILRWGDGVEIMSLMKDIAFRKNGLGDLLANGVYRASKVMGRGTGRYAMHVKGAGMCEQGVRSFKGWALGIMTSTRGGGHLAGAPNTEQRKMSREEGQKFFNVSTAGDPLAYNGKGRLVAWFERYKVITDTLGLCTSTTYWIDCALLGPDDFAMLLNAATGWDFTGNDLMNLGERIYNIEKSFNTLHANFSRADDMPPYKLISIPVSEGPFKGERLESQAWNSMLDEYYKEHDWDIETGWQTDVCLYGLGLSDVAKKLEKVQRLIKVRPKHVS